MAKKNWIFIKRGLSEDPKHRERMKEAIWLFLHICDAADWETGMVYDWRDKEIAIEMSLSPTTVRGWRDRLADLGYITCKQKQHGLEIIIHNWTNPRDYGGKKINLRQGDTTMSPSKNEDLQDFDEDESQVDPQVDPQGQGDPIVNDGSFIQSSSSSSSSSESTTRAATQNVFKVYESNIGILSPFIADALADAEDQYGPGWVCAAIEEAVKSEARNWKYCEAILRRWKVQGFKSEKQKPSQPRRGGYSRPKSGQAQMEEIMAKEAASGSTI